MRFEPNPAAVHEEALEVAWNAARNAGYPRGLNGCGRVYVVLSELDRAARARVKKWAARRGRLFCGREGHVRDGIYVGYDNASGIEASRADAIVENLKSLGIGAYAEYMED